MRKIKIGTRKSPLARKQVDEVCKQFAVYQPEAKCEIVDFDTRGDRDKKTPIDKFEGSDFFTDKIQSALTLGLIDVAIHSAKDLPDEQIKGHILYISESSIDPDEVLVSKNNLIFNELPQGAKIGTSSTRRKEQLLRARPDLAICDLRGNIGERLNIFDEGNLDAIVIAAAGLVRLGLNYRISERLVFMEPHILQGKLALEIRYDDREMIQFVEGVAGWRLWKKN